MLISEPEGQACSRSEHIPKISLELVAENLCVPVIVVAEKRSGSEDWQ